MNPESALVSIVLPTYNGSRLIRGSIDSCLNQTHRNIELIVIDDCSTDESPSVIRSYQDPRIRYFRNAKNQRLPRSLNIGFARTTGDYLTWTSDDNEYTLDAIAKMLACLQKDPEAQFVYSDVWAYYEETDKKERLFLEDIDLKARNGLRGSFMYTRKVYETIGDYNPHYEMVEDYDYWLRIFKRFKAVRLAEPVYFYRYHAKSLTTTRTDEQVLFDSILKYRNGYVSASKLGQTAADYMAKTLRSDGTAGQKILRLARLWMKIASLSPVFFMQFLALGGYFLFIRAVRSIFVKLSIIKAK